MERSAPTEVCDISRNCASVNSPAPGTSRSMTYLGMSILRKLCHASMHVRPLQECRSPVEPEVAARVRETCVGNEGIMDLRSLQKPLKEQYRADPNASRITIRAKGAQTGARLGCWVTLGGQSTRPKRIREWGARVRALVPVICCWELWLLARR